MIIKTQIDIDNPRYILSIYSACTAYGYSDKLYRTNKIVFVCLYVKMCTQNISHENCKICMGRSQHSWLIVCL